jgi:hypothetical protein
VYISKCLFITSLTPVFVFEPFDLFFGSTIGILHTQTHSFKHWQKIPRKKGKIVHPLPCAMAASEILLGFFFSSHEKILFFLTAPRYP